jgi:hypothetical protein
VSAAEGDRAELEPPGGELGERKAPKLAPDAGVLTSKPGAAFDLATGTYSVVLQV